MAEVEGKLQPPYTKANEEASVFGTGEEGVYCHGVQFLLLSLPPSGLNGLLVCGVAAYGLNMEDGWKTSDLMTLMSLISTTRKIIS